VAPAPLEDRLRAHWLIDHCILVEWKAVHRKPSEATVAELRTDTQLLASIQLAVDEANQLVSHAEAIKRFRIVPASFAVSDELTPTQKVRRDCVLAKFAEDADALYAGVS
jgi:long-chain acyl-CoA synthetase